MNPQRIPVQLPVDYDRNVNPTQMYPNQTLSNYPNQNINIPNSKMNVTDAEIYRNNIGNPIMYQPNHYYGAYNPMGYGWPVVGMPQPIEINHRYPVMINPSPANIDYQREMRIPQQGDQGFQRMQYPQNQQEYQQRHPMQGHQTQIKRQDNPRVVGSSPVYYTDQANQHYYNKQGQQKHENQLENENQQKQDPIFWSKKFFTIFQRFEWAYQRFDILKKQYEELCQQLKVVDSEEQWNDLKEHHEEFMEKFIQMQDQITTVMAQNQQLLEQRPEGTEEEAIWQQRYQQLLQNYKNLQQEVSKNHMSPNQQKRQSGAQLAKQYRELNVQYTKVFNEVKELKKKQIRDNQQINNTNEKLQYAMQQNEKYKSHLEKMHEEIDELRNAMNDHQTQNINLKRQLATKPKIDSEEYEKFMKIIQEKENQITQVKRQLNKEKEKNYLANDDQIKKNTQINELKEIINRYQNQYQSTLPQEFNRMILIKTQQINQYRKMLKNLEEDYLNRLEEAEINFQKDHAEEVAKLKKQIQSNESHQAQRPIYSSRAADMSLKKIAYFQQELINLNDVVNKKNQQIIQLRELTAQIENAKHLKLQIEAYQREKQQLEEIISTKDREIQKIKFELGELSEKFKQLSQKKTDGISRGLLQQISQLKQIIASKDYEIQKNKNITQTRQKKITQLQGQADVLRSKIISLEKAFQNQREAMRSQNKTLETRIVDQDRKIRSLEFDFGESLKHSLQTQISSLRTQNHNKQQTIVKLQNNEIQLKGKICQIERQKRDIENDLKDLKHRVSKQDNWKLESERRTQHLNSEIETRNKIIKSAEIHEENLKNQLNKLEIQLEESENTIRIKNDIIKQFQMKIQQINQQSNDRARDRDHYKAQYKASEENNSITIRKLKEQNQEYLQLINSGKLQSDLYLANHQNLQIISNLKSQNQKLKAQFTKIFEGALFKSTNKSEPTEGFNFIQKRLNDFNSKLQSIMDDNPHSKMTNKENAKSVVSTLDKNKDEVKELKSKLSSLQEYCNTLQSRLDGQILPNPNRKIVMKEQEKIYGQEMQFYRKQTKQFEERIQSLLKINKQMKARLQSLLKSSNENSSVSYYKAQLEQAEKTIENLNQKINKLADQSRSIRSSNTQINNKYLREYQNKQFQNQNQIQQLNRKIRLFQIEKRATLLHNISKFQSNIDILKSSLTQKINMHQNINRDLNSKCVQYENQIAKLMHKLKDYENQNTKVNKLLHQLSDSKSNESSFRYIAH